ncbi:hypothetical protein IC608_04875 [Devosia sp. PTR5]|uniref:Uncharacterized protein n=1 Tax=Devosia oryzisoli TaxID=2774138 RepID=A0A927FU42_9HYPH|nr:hypothetical protein [Devosia oryzisoli]MBD8064808.1 hypothetical protein [Devosia oryzisoli]
MRARYSGDIPTSPGSPMSFLLSAPIRFFDEDQLEEFAEFFSDRVRRDKTLSGALVLLIGNRWAHAETAFTCLMKSTLLAEGGTPVDINWLAKLARTLSPEHIEQLSDIFVDCAFQLFPVNVAADFVELSSELAISLQALVNAQGLEQQRRLLRLRDELKAGALMSSL